MLKRACTPNRPRRWALGAGALFAAVLAILWFSVEIASKTLSDATRPGLSAAQLARIDASLREIDAALSRADPRVSMAGDLVSRQIAAIDSVWLSVRVEGNRSAARDRFETLWNPMREQLRHWDQERSAVMERGRPDPGEARLRDDLRATLGALAELRHSARADAWASINTAMAALDRWRLTVAGVTALSALFGGWTLYRMAVRLLHVLRSRRSPSSRRRQAVSSSI